MEWMGEQLGKLKNFVQDFFFEAMEVLYQVVVFLRDWFIFFVSQVWAMLQGWFWSVMDALGVTEYFDAFDAMGELVGPYLWFAVWAIPIVPVTLIITSAWAIAWTIVGIRHAVGILSINAG